MLPGVLLRFLQRLLQQAPLACWSEPLGHESPALERCGSVIPVCVVVSQSYEFFLTNIPTGQTAIGQYRPTSEQTYAPSIDAIAERSPLGW